ncbi:MAG: N-acetylmuramoyl-L-alanine amidase [Polaribacter sp.]|jgi:N-acetylmuramoyl-L-alanine amidase
MLLLTHTKFNNNKKWFLFIISCCFLFGVTDQVIAQGKTYTIVLDAGHGGTDPGNIGNGYREKNIALKTALEVGKIIGAKKGVNIIYTRKTDVIVDLWKRGNIANDVKADLFVSIHCDAHTSSAYGAGTFVLGLHANKRNFDVAKRENSVILLEKNYEQNYKYNPNSPESIIGLSLLQEENLEQSLLLASSIQNNFIKKNKRKNRGVKQAGFVVLYQTTMPSVLVELGFLTNKKEGRYLNSRNGQKAMAKSIASSIAVYIDQLKLNSVSIVNKENAVAPKDVKTKIINKDEVFFKIQISSSKRKIAAKSYNFKGLRNIERVKVQSYYKYYYGKTSNYKNIQSLLKRVKKKGYRSAFIAAFKNGEKISVRQALKTR